MPHGKGENGCGSSFVHIEGSAAVDASSGAVARAAEIRMFSAGIARKHEEKRVLENAQIEVPG